MTTTVSSILAEYHRYKALAEAAIAQLDDAALAAQASPTDNSIATICWHVSGNLESRFTDFLATDGEKPWRNREEEFAARSVSRDALLEKWERGWGVLLANLEPLTESDLQRTITIREQPLLVIEALHRSLAHTAYHVGQIVYLAKALKAGQWHYLSIAPGKTAEYNRKPDAERGGAHAERLTEGNKPV